tara:strand:- start:1077 stop:1253 length:177 start_codon:yes stop_codon:yes gene_type:complete
MSLAQAKNNNVFDLNKARSSAKKKKARALHSNHQQVQLGIVNRMWLFPILCGYGSQAG